jgi:Protein of unknown function (DUF2905)
MNDLGGLGRVLIATGLVLAAFGVLLVFAGRIPLLGRLPGDIVVQRENWTVYVPLATMLLLSLVLTLVLNLFAGRFRG